MISLREGRGGRERAEGTGALTIGLPIKTLMTNKPSESIALF